MKFFKIKLPLLFMAALFVAACAQTNARQATILPLREILGPQTQVLQDATKWPKTVPVRSPDPIFGGASHLEIWSYDQRFARRFEGFPQDQADPDMPAGLWAVVLRVYKQSYAPFYPDQKLYSCQLDLYVDDNVPVRVTQNKSTTFTFLGALPTTATELKAKDGRDALLLKEMVWSIPSIHLGDKVEHPADKQMAVGLQFTDGKLRGILNTFGVLDYRKKFLPGMQLMRTGVEFTNGGCEKFYPIAKNSKMVLRFGDADTYDSYNRNLSQGTHGSVGQNVSPFGDLRFHPNLPNNGVWRWTPQDLAKGLIALPDKLSKRGVEIVAMVRDLNQCILDENMIQKGRFRATEERQAQRLQTCKRLRETGELYYTSGYDYRGSGWSRLDTEWSCTADFFNDISTRKANTEWCAKPNPR